MLEVSEKILTAITRRDNPQAVVGVFTQRLQALSDIRPERDDVWVALDRVRDPGNLGTVIRTVDAVGARGVILVGDTTDPFSLETVRATMGSIFAVPIARASSEAFLARAASPALALVLLSSLPMAVLVLREAERRERSQEPAGKAMAADADVETSTR